MFADTAARRKKSWLLRTHPAHQNRFGRAVSNFNRDLWKQPLYEIVFRVNRVKPHDRPFCCRRVATGDKTLAEASMYDLLCGIPVGFNSTIYAFLNLRYGRDSSFLGGHTHGESPPALLSQVT